MCDKKNSVLINDTECIVLSPNFKLTDETQFLLKVPRKNNMYGVDLKNIVPNGEAPYELFLGRKPALGFMRPFRCPVTILNTIDHLGKFDGKADEGFFVGYSINSKAFRVFNNRTKIVEENLHVQFSENTLNIAGSRPNCLFDIDALTKSMNYKPVVARNQSNSNAGTKACDDAGKARIDSPDVGFKPLSDDGKKVDEDSRNSEGIDQEKEDNVNSTNNVNAANTNEVNAVCGKTSIELPEDPNMPPLEDIVYSDNDDDVGAEADMKILQVAKQEGGLRIFLCQDKYVTDILKKFGFTDVKTASTPMETQKLLLKDKDGEDVDVHLYRSMIGSLMYLTSSRHDIMFVVCACARYQVNPKVSHLHAVKRIFRYLKGAT
ncbi:ribonuclease H-like domain-containing protein [Tanacetum coccineum]